MCAACAIVLVTPKAKASFSAYDHQVWNFGHQTRVVLFFDVWAPDLKEEDLVVILGCWSNIKQSMSKVADAYERMSKKVVDADAEDKDDWFITEKPR